VSVECGVCCGVDREMLVGWYRTKGQHNCVAGPQHKHIYVAGPQHKHIYVAGPQHNHAAYPLHLAIRSSIFSASSVHEPLWPLNAPHSQSTLNTQHSALFTLHCAVTNFTAVSFCSTEHHRLYKPVYKKCIGHINILYSRHSAVSGSMSLGY
jgi:hypothetical protein